MFEKWKEASSAMTVDAVKTFSKNVIYALTNVMDDEVNPELAIYNYNGQYIAYRQIEERMLCMTEESICAYCRETIKEIDSNFDRWEEFGTKAVMEDIEDYIEKRILHIRLGEEFFKRNLELLRGYKIASIKVLELIS